LQIPKSHYNPVGYIRELDFDELNRSNSPQHQKTSSSKKNKTNLPQISINSPKYPKSPKKSEIQLKKSKATANLLQILKKEKELDNENFEYLNTNCHFYLDHFEEMKQRLKKLKFYEKTPLLSPFMPFKPRASIGKFKKRVMDKIQMILHKKNQIKTVNDLAFESNILSAESQFSALKTSLKKQSSVPSILLKRLIISDQKKKNSEFNLPILRANIKMKV